MTKFIAFIILVALRIASQPSNAQTDRAPFASTSSLSSGDAILHQDKLISFNGKISNNKVFLQWEVSENETADLFEIEKSTDGKYFTMAALVFGIDKPETCSYWFYEKAKTKKCYYRIKAINKNKQIEYSAVIEINPSI